MKSLIFILLIAGCAQAGSPLKAGNRTIDSALAPTLASFNAYAALQGVSIPASREDNLILEFDLLGQPGASGGMVVGMCLIGPYGANGTLAFVAQIDKAYWTASNPTVREEVVFHELGHCLLGRQHRNDANSLMNAFLLPESTYDQDHAGFIAELFTHLNDGGYTSWACER